MNLSLNKNPDQNTIYQMKIHKERIPNEEKYNLLAIEKIGLPHCLPPKNQDITERKIKASV